MNLHDQWITEARILSTDELAELVRSTIQDYKTPSAMSSNGVGELMARLSVLGERGFPCRWADYQPAVEQPASPEPDWAVLGPELLLTLRTINANAAESVEWIRRCAKDVLAKFPA